MSTGHYCVPVEVYKPTAGATLRPRQQQAAPSHFGKCWKAEVRRLSPRRVLRGKKKTCLNPEGKRDRTDGYRCILIHRWLGYP